MDTELLRELAKELIEGQDCSNEDRVDDDDDDDDNVEEFEQGQPNDTDEHIETEEDLINGLLGHENRHEENEDHQHEDHEDARIGGAGPGLQIQRPLTHSFGDPGFLQLMGSLLQQTAFKRYLQCVATATDSPVQGIRSQKHQKVTRVVIDEYVWKSKIKSFAAVAEHNNLNPKTISSTLSCAACLMLQGCCWMLGTLLASMRQLFRSNIVKPVVVVNKFRYDETPLRMKISEYNQFLSSQGDVTSSSTAVLKDEDDYRFAKIFRVDWELSFLIHEPRKGNYRMISVHVPVPLSAVERNTAECLASSLTSATNRVPEYGAFIQDFPSKIRMACVDRFGSNLKAERYIQTLTGELSTVLTCDIHKIAGSMKKGFQILDDTMSGLVNLGLALEAAGSLNAIRSILQEIIDQELTIVYDNAPGGHILQHRIAVLNRCCPLHNDPRRRFQAKVRQRRFIIQALANSDITKTDICHYCAFGCCDSAERTKYLFKRFLTWALVPCKLPVLSRKSWTGSSSAISWCTLLHSHWHLLPRIILRYLSVDRPRSIISEDTMEDVPQQQLLQPIGDLEDFDMMQFADLLPKDRAIVVC